MYHDSKSGEKHFRPSPNKRGEECTWTDRYGNFENVYSFKRKEVI